MGSLLDQIKTGSRPGKPKIGSRGTGGKKTITRGAKGKYVREGVRGQTRPARKMRVRGAKGVVRKG